MLVDLHNISMSMLMGKKKNLMKKVIYSSIRAVIRVVALMSY